MAKRIFAAALFLGLTACRTDLFLGKVEGVAANVFAPNGRTPAYRAGVVIEDVKPYGYYGETLTSQTGAFSFPGVPDGFYQINVTSPNGFFETGFYVEVVDGHSPGDVKVSMAPARVGTFLNVPGRYDDMGVILLDLGYAFRSVGIENLAQSADPLEDADIVCLNSGVDTAWAQDEKVVKRLQSFVWRGGRLVASDQAWPFIKAGWPEKVTWPQDPAVGNGNQNVDASFTDADLRRCATVSKWVLRYDLGKWALPKDTRGTAFVRGNVKTSSGSRNDAPLLFGFTHGSGFVLFSTFGWRAQYSRDHFAVRVFNYFIANK
ncbi:MAG: hypothetical protein GTN49_08820 [candidate division Zixibacteria bacterium]|nr:hypothetical protein [candidate division Zixibacteria bacterium]